MAGVGQRHYLSQSELQAAFEQAKEAGADYLVRFSYTSQGRPMTMQGASFMLDMIDFHEGTRPLSKESAPQDLKAIYDEYGALNIRAVYPLSGSFKGTAKGDESLLPAEALTAARAAIERDKQEAAQAVMAARPLWKKLLGLNP